MPRQLTDDGFRYACLAQLGHKLMTQVIEPVG
jgi:hypothetical protein